MHHPAGRTHHVAAKHLRQGKGRGQERGGSSQGQQGVCQDGPFCPAEPEAGVGLAACLPHSSRSWNAHAAG